MRKILRVILWLGAGFLVLLLLAVIGVTIYTRTERFTRWARDEGVAAVNNLIQGSLTVERLEGSVWRHLVLHNVGLRYQDKEILIVPRLEVSFSLLPLIWGELRISSIDADGPRATLLQDQEGRWNVVEAFLPRHPEPEKKSEFVALVDRFRLVNAAIHLRPTANDSTPYDLTDLNLQGRMGIRPAGLILNVDEVTTQLATPGKPELRLKGGLEYTQAETPGSTFKVKDLWAVSRNSRIKINGEVTPAETLKVKVDALVDRLAPADIAYFVPQWPLKPVLAGNVSVAGPLDDLNGAVQLASVGAKIAGKFRADVTRETILYSATATVSGFDLRQWLNNPSLAGVLGGTVEAAGKGFALGDIAGTTRLQVRSAETEGWKLGDVNIEGRLQKSIASIDGRLNSTTGGANWSGKINLADKRPSYDLQIAVKDFDLQQVGQSSKALNGKLNFRGTVTGSGISLADMNAHADVQVLPSSVASIAVNEGNFNLNLNGNKVRIARAVLSTADSTVSAAGEFGLDGEMSGSLDYRARIGNVAPWLALVSRKGSGSMDLAGRAQGSLSDLQTRGTARLSALQVDGMGLKNGSIGYSLRGSKEQFFPEGNITATLIDLDAGLTLRRIEANAKLSRQLQSIDLTLTAQDSQDRKHNVAGIFNFSPDALIVKLNQASLAAPDGIWKLFRPATVMKHNDSISIDQFALRNGERQVSISGSFAFSGGQDLNVNVDRLPVETLTAFLSEPPKMSGLLALRARVTGTAAAPELTASARLSNSTVAGQSYDGADADMSYKDKQASVRLAVRQDSTHTLTGTGNVPLNLSWQNGWRAEFGDGLDARAQSAGLSIAFLNAFSGKTAENISGDLSLDVTARGSIKAPNLGGTFHLRNGKLRVIPAGVDVNQVAMDGRLDSSTITIGEFIARAQDGEIRGNGALPLRDYDRAAVKLLLSAKNWPAIQTARYQAKIAGNVAVQGALLAPRVTGQLTVLEGSLRPDLAFLEQSKVPLQRDETILVVDNSAGREPEQRLDQEAAPSSNNLLFKKLSVDLTVRVPGNLWIRHPSMVSEISGNVRATKEPDAEVDLTGRIDIVRGSLVFQGRRFQLTRGSVQFTGGGKINPTLDIAAQYKLPEYDVEVVLTGTAQKPSLTLSSQPRLDQADILAVLLFGRPINSLNQNQRGSVQQSALNIASGYVAGKLASSVTQALGLDTLGLDVGDLDTSGGRIGFGHYVGNKTYFSVGQELSGEHGQDVSLEYQIAPNWKIGTSRSTTGSNAIDIIWQKRY
ncbi:MAG TPA: translocation/assembly module TamB domain-containing protein [Candidatus Binatia bacterium]|nr:translocation/assembly module TamB domain-containing protein [Candidatus Binatia bacterium]